MKTILITGATGFIGSNLLNRCLKEKYKIRCFVLSNDPKKEKLSSKNVEIVEGNIKNYSEVKEACRNISIIFHLAGIVTDYAPHQLYHDVNVQGMENICKAAVEEKVNRVVYMSTCDVFGTQEEVIMDESFPLQKWNEPYADTKIEAEKIAWRYYQDFNLPITMVYGCWIYGENDFTFTAMLADAIVKNDLIFWRKDVHVWLNYIENLVDFLLLISQDIRAIGNGYLLHDGEMITLQKFCQIIAKTMEIPFKERYIPYWLAKIVAWSMEHGSRLLKRKKRPLLTTYIVTNLGSRFNFSNNKAITQLNWNPRFSAEEGLTKTMNWLKTVDLTQLKQK